MSAFASNFVQISGLWGDDGVLPANSYLERIKTWPDMEISLGGILWEGVEIVVDWVNGVCGLDAYSNVETGLYAICLIGTLLSLGALLSHRINNSFTFLALWLLYQANFWVGQTFLSFQWDILLLEIGFIAIFYARFPLFNNGDETSLVQLMAREGLRWALFRLMFASGVLKVSSNCQTWTSYTALYYHYET